MGGKQNKHIPLECMIKKFQGGYSGDYDIKLTPGKLWMFYEIDWPSFGVGWLPRGH